MVKRVLQPGHWGFLAVVSLMTMFTPMSTDMYLPSFPVVSKFLNVHIVELQLTLTSFMAGMGIGQMFWGPISDRFGRKRPAYIGAILFIIASLLCTTVTSLPMLIFYRFLQAFGGSAALVSSRAIVRDTLHGVEMAKMMSAIAMVFVFAPAFAPTVGSFVMHFFSWHAIFYTLTIFGALVLFGMTRLPESLPPEKRNTHGFSDSVKIYSEILKNKEFRQAAVISIMGSTVTFGWVSSSPAVLMGIYGVSRSTFGILFGLISIGLLTSSRVNIRLVSKFGVVKMLRGFTLVQTSAAALLLLISFFHPPVWAILTLVIIIFGCAPSMSGNSMTIGMHPFPHKAASAAALLGLMQFSGSAIVSALLSTFHTNVLVNMALAMFTGALIAFLQTRKIRLTY